MYSSLHFILVPPGLGPTKKGPRRFRREAPMPPRPPSAANAARDISRRRGRNASLRAVRRPQVPSAGDVAPRLTPVSARTARFRRVRTVRVPSSWSNHESPRSPQPAQGVHPPRQPRQAPRGRAQGARLRDRARRVRRHPRPERLGQVDARPAALDAAAPGRRQALVFGHDAFTDTRAVRRLVNRVSVEASFFKKMRATENLSYAARFYGLRPHETRGPDPGDPRRASASPPTAATSRWRTSRAGCSRRSRSRGRC